MSEVIIPVGDRYEVTIGPQAWTQVPAAIGERAHQVLLVHAPGIEPLVQRVSQIVSAAGYRLTLAPVPNAEAAKTLQTAAGLWSLLGQHDFTRTDVVLGLGGGATTDLAGFVAASWLRGVPVVQIPTTLLGMVDAAVGGKTGINTPEGKNLVGAFHEPAAVVIDPSVLDTLPQPDLVAGLAEVIKAGFIRDPQILDLIEADPQLALQVGGPVLGELIERAVRVKAQVVSADLTEASLREILNYGHTFGHAIEQAEGYRWRHGEAVAVGMMFVAELACAAGLLEPTLRDRHRSILQAVGLPTQYAGSADWSALLAAMRRDKKARGEQLRFVVLEALARPTRLEGPPMGQVHQAYRAVTSR